ncbi:MAG: TonB-dependent receptor plug domain-containing protein [Deltaproteobacteria bacterium]|nr:TonB-dependent receptor plug domain-containing protein [Deltaproteobacteria bacterium]
MLRALGLVAVLCAVAPGRGLAAEALATASAISLEDELEFLVAEDFIASEVTVASIRPLPTRLSPGIVSVLTGQELMSVGARDLIDALQLIPGLAFGVDVQGVVGLGVRGLWGHEGKVLLLLDGHELNESHYSTLQFGNHLPVELIDRVEIIRGPGSALYGGHAELAVINIVTRVGSGAEGVHASASWGQTLETWARRRVTLGWGGSVGDLQIGVAGWLGQGQRSDGIFRDSTGATLDLQGQADLDPAGLDLRLAWKGLTFSFLHDSYRTTHRTGYGELLAAPAPADFTSTYLELAWNAALSERLTLTPRLRWHRQAPWRTPGMSPDDPNWFDSPVQRGRAGLQLEYQTAQGVDLIFGVEGYIDEATLPEEVLEEKTFSNGGRRFQIKRAAAHLQALIDVAEGTLALGARYEASSRFDASLVPRVALTQPFGRFHFKLLAARAYRAPSIQNIDLGPGITPETTDVVEAEVGYLLTDTLSLALNLFDTTLRGPIVYQYDPITFEEGYVNGTQVHTRGFEVEGRWRHRWVALRASYGFYVAMGRQTQEVFGVPGHHGELLGLPAHKLSIVATCPLGSHLRLAPGLVFLSRRWARTTDPAGAASLEALPAAALLDLALEAHDLGVEGLSISLSLHDLLGAEPAFAQPYDGGHPPLPGPSRELLLRVSWTPGG